MYRKSGMKHIDFLIVDILSLEVSFLIAHFLRLGTWNLYADMIYRNMAIALVLIDFFVMFFWESFSGVLRRGYYQEFVLTLKHGVSVMLLSVLYLFSFQMGANYSRLTLFLTGGIYIILSYITRRLWRLYLERVKHIKKEKRSMMIIAEKNNAKNIVDDIVENNYERITLSGLAIIDADMTGKKLRGIPVVASRDNVLEYVCREWVDEVFIDLPENEPFGQELIDRFIEMGITVHWSLVKLKDTKTRKQEVERIGSHTVLTMGVNMMTIRQAFLKRAMDIAGGIVGCSIMCILFIFVAPVMMIKSPGPIFFTQTRIGKNGHKFKVYKFRSMYMDAEERKKELMAQNKVKDGMMFKMDYDPRIIGSEKGPGKGFGNFIRKTSIDEFPQFINVLKGDMSLVGTRPPTEDEWVKYELHHRARLAIKPGITGMWQVSGRSSITDFEEVVRLDTQYITNWSFALDIKILIKTVFTVLKKEGAS